MTAAFEDPFSSPTPTPPTGAVRVTLPYPISANRYWATRAFVSKDTRKPMASTYVTSEAKQYKEAVGWLLRSAGVRCAFPGRVHVHIQLWPHRPLDWAKRAKKDPLYWADTVQRLDLDNARKVVTDALKGIAIDDDRQIWRDSGEVMEPDGRDACLVVTITPLVPQVQQPALELA